MGTGWPAPDVVSSTRSPTPTFSCEATSLGNQIPGPDEDDSLHDVLGRVRAGDELHVGRAVVRRDGRRCHRRSSRTAGRRPGQALHRSVEHVADRRDLRRTEGCRCGRRDRCRSSRPAARSGRPDTGSRRRDPRAARRWPRTTRTTGGTRRPTRRPARRRRPRRRRRASGTAGTGPGATEAAPGDGSSAGPASAESRRCRPGVALGGGLLEDVDVEGRAETGLEEVDCAPRLAPREVVTVDELGQQKGPRRLPGNSL